MKQINDTIRALIYRIRGGDYYAFLRRIGYANDPAYTAKLKRF